MNDRMLSVDAALSIDIDKQKVLVRGHDGQIVIEFSTFGLALRLLRRLGSLKTVRTRANSIVDSLAAVGLTVTLQTPQRKLITIGRDGNSWLMRTLGFPNARLHFFPVRPLSARFEVGIR